MKHIKSFEQYNESVRLMTLDSKITREIQDSIAAGYNEIRVGLITPKKRGVALVNKKDQVRGTYPLEYKDIIQDMIDRANEANEGKAPDWKVGQSYQDGIAKKVQKLGKDKVKVTFDTGDSYVYQIDKYNPENWVQVDEATINEAINIVSSTGDESSVDTALIDKLIKQIGPATGYTDWKERAKKVDYVDVIEKVAKSFLGLSSMQNSNITIKK